MRKLAVTLLLLILTIMPSVSWAASPNREQAAPTNTTETTEQTNQGEGGTAGIKPVSPKEFTGKVNTTIGGLYNTSLPIVDCIAVLALCGAGFAAMFVLFSGADMVRRVLGAVFGIGIGLLLYYGAPYVAGLIKGLTMAN